MTDKAGLLVTVPVLLREPPLRLLLVEPVSSMDLYRYTPVYSIHFKPSFVNRRYRRSRSYAGSLFGVGRGVATAKDG